MNYDYKAGKKRVEEILDSSLEVIESPKLPAGDEFTFTNAYESWVMAVFVDLRDSTTLMSGSDQAYVAKVVRSFTSEIIEILRGDNRERELGIRGDCVYAIYTTPLQTDTYDVFEKAVWINTYLKMLNAILKNKGFDTIKAGIGVALGKDHVIKAGRKGVGINATVWMGNAVSKAAKLSGYGQKEVPSSIVLSNLVYDNIIDQYKKNTHNENPEDWFKTSRNLPPRSKYCNIIKIDMNEWIKEGMPD